ncbi:hypothetical protein PoB_001660800 [Plakobranchus ocellatus]|uniref:Uncharacterized protein n=1 Tax=Plakobranchus ocellatus TaxID=259542 RepID=A0AAV3Z656_9GAST|nr:hypothetical protein PoB_001660800 [Plakobranchus ocellatus]
MTPVHVAHSHSQTDEAGMPVAREPVSASSTEERTGILEQSSSSDVCSQTEAAITTSSGKGPKKVTVTPEVSSSEAHSQTDVINPCGKTLKTDEQAVQATPFAADVFSQTEITSATCNGKLEADVSASAGRSVRVPASADMSSQTESGRNRERGVGGGEDTLQQLDLQQIPGQTSGALDFQCQAWPDSRDVASQVEAEDGM